MKVSNLSLIVSGLLTSVSAFTDTASFYSSEELLCNPKYIVEASKLSNSIEALTENICSSKKDKLTIYRVSNLLSGTSSKNGTYLKHVFYNSINELDFSFGESCSEKVKYCKNFVGDQEDASIIIVDVEDDNEHHIDDFLGGNVIVQGKPSFHRPGTQFEAVKEFMEDSVYDNLNIDVDTFFVKREVYEDSEVELKKLEEEIESDFKAAESYIEAQGDDELFTISEEKDIITAVSLSDTAASNLFTNYQFFTPGIWSGLLVSAFLLYVLSTALRWMTSLEITYAGFDKQYKFANKND